MVSPPHEPMTSLLRNRLLTACENGDVDEVHALLARDASTLLDAERTQLLNSVGDAARRGDTPLTGACRYNRRAVVALLLALGADTNARTKTGDTALRVAAQSGFTEIATMLLASGADLEARSLLGMTPLHSACRFGSILELYRGGVDTSDGIPSAMSSARAELQILVASLLDNGADVNATDNRGQIPLHCAACGHGDPELVRVLLASGADIDTPDTRGRTPVHLALTTGNMGVVMELLARGADVDTKSNASKTLLHTAARHNPDAVVFELEAHGTGSPSRAAVGFNDPVDDSLGRQIVTELLAREADANAIDSSGETPLSYARQYARDRNGAPACIMITHVF